MWREMGPEKQKPFYEKAEKLKAQQEKANPGTSHIGQALVI